MHLDSPIEDRIEAEEEERTKKPVTGEERKTVRVVPKFDEEVENIFRELPAECDEAPHFSGSVIAYEKIGGPDRKWAFG